MAIPGIPNNFNVQTGNRQVLVTWDLSAGATSYIVERSLDNVTFSVITTISGSPLATQYLDTAVVIDTQYWYRVAASTTDGASSFTSSSSVIPSPTGEMSLKAIRISAQNTADRAESDFVTMPEWNSFINLAMNELYDLLITTYEDLYVATPIQFTTNGSTYLYPLPDGVLSFSNALDLNQQIVAKPFYKLLGIDLQIQNTNNGYVTLNKFNFINRNQFVYPNTSSTIYGVFNMKYRLLGSNIEFIPTPSASQGVRVWYIPRLKELLLDTDTTDIGISGWLRYVIVRAAKYYLDKEESDTTKLDQELLFLKARIEETASNRDAGSPDTISDARSTRGWGAGSGSGNGWGSSGGF